MQSAHPLSALAACLLSCVLLPAHAAVYRNNFDDPLDFSCSAGGIKTIQVLPLSLANPFSIVFVVCRLPVPVGAQAFSQTTHVTSPRSLVCLLLLPFTFGWRNR